MAAFYRNTCSWHNCTKKCSSLIDLIDHIEMVHIERDPAILEKQEASQPAAVALSYVNCFFSDALRRKKSGGSHDSGSQALGKRSPSVKHPKPQVTASDNQDGFMEEEGSLSDATSDDSCQSWATNTSQDGLSTDLLLSRLPYQEGDDGKKRFICNVPGCGKRYKNVNGIKYHMKNGHRKPDNTSAGTVNNGTPAAEVRKGYKCHCGKSYKSQSGLRHHQNTQHGNKNTPNTKGNNHSQPISTANLTRPEVFDSPGQTVTPVS